MEIIKQTKKKVKKVLKTEEQKVNRKVLGIFLSIGLIVGSIVGVRAAIQPLTLISLENNFASAINAYNSSMATAKSAEDTFQTAVQTTQSNSELLCNAYKALKALKEQMREKIKDPLFNPCTQMRGYGVQVEVEPVATEVAVGGMVDYSKFRITENLQQFKVAVTSYNPTVEQNDEAPCIGASGLDQCVLAEKGVRMLALSRDLRSAFLAKKGEYFKYPMPVYVESDNEGVSGCYWVVDTLSSHKYKDTPRETPITNQIDLFFMNGADNKGGTARVSNKIENCSDEFFNQLQK